MELLRNDLDPEEGTGSQKLPAHTDHRQRTGKSKSHPQSVKERYQRRVLAGIGLGTAQDDTVHNDQRDINSKRRIKRRHISLDQQLHDRNQAGYDYDKRRDPNPVGNNVPQGRDQHIGKHQYGCRGKSHTKAVDGGGGGRQSRTHPQHQDEGRVFFYDAVINTFYTFIHKLPPPIPSNYAGNTKPRSLRLSSLPT